MTRPIEVPPRESGVPVRVPATAPTKKPSGTRNERHISAQEPLFKGWVEKATPLQLVFDDGTELYGTLVAHDTYALHIEDAEKQPILVFKQSLRWVKES